MNALQQKLRARANNYIRTQVKFLLCGCALLLIYNVTMAWSALLGGAICILANWVFAKKMFANTGAAATRKIVGSFYSGELHKILITVILFTLTIRFVPVDFLAFISGYALTQVSFWLIPLTKAMLKPMEQPLS